MSKNGSIYLGLPRQFQSPQRAALRLSELQTLAQREAYFARIPPQWQNWIRHQAVIQIAGEIVALATVEERRKALLETPETWREEIKAHVLRLWQMPRSTRMEGAA
jgi:predicted proteasome-type protease